MQSQLNIADPILALQGLISIVLLLANLVFVPWTIIGIPLAFVNGILYIHSNDPQKKAARREAIKMCFIGPIALLISSFVRALLQ